LPLHLYFDILSGLIQTLVFVLLTMIYWKMESKTN
jgi:F0F1-type ATP synthase membrane subunit a